jgi:hypothetical protein
MVKIHKELQFLLFHRVVLQDPTSKRRNDQQRLARKPTKELTHWMKTAPMVKIHKELQLTNNDLVYFSLRTLELPLPITMKRSKQFES